MNVLSEITLGQIAVCATFIVGFIASINKLADVIERVIKKVVQPELDTIKADLDSLNKKSDEQYLETIKEYLVLVMSDIEKGDKLDEVELSLFLEKFNYYTSKGGNSYIHRKYDKLKEEGKI